jgi:tungstate transport system substrate-binding protein
MRSTLVLSLLLLAGCSGSSAAPSLTLATTTSTQDTGLLDVLLPRFRERTGIEVKPVAVGTGQALELGRRGDADVLLVHAPDAERRFMAEGFGSSRRPVMYNPFVLAGPPDDPAGVRSASSAALAFRRIAEHKALFVSRGDESGTHQKEKEIWKEAGLEPHGDWYRVAGAGMAQVLRVASEKRAYTLSDRGTFLALKDECRLAILHAGDAALVNPYHVITVDPVRHPHVKAEAAQRFAAFLVSPDAQDVIRQFGVERFGEPLFFVGEPPREE